MTNDLLKLIIAICTALITGFLIPYLRSRIGDSKYNKMIDMIKVAVNAAEQTMQGGVVKKEYVVDFVREWLAKQGIDIEYSQLDALIESAVYALKNG